MIEMKTSVRMAIEAGRVKAGGRLAAVLERIESAYRANAPGDLVGAVAVLGRVTEGLSLEPSYVVSFSAGEAVLRNVGGITTRVAGNGNIRVSLGEVALVHILVLGG